MVQSSRRIKLTITDWNGSKGMWGTSRRFLEGGRQAMVAVGARAVTAGMRHVAEGQREGVESLELAEALDEISDGQGGVGTALGALAWPAGGTTP